MMASETRVLFTVKRFIRNSTSLNLPLTRLHNCARFQL
jgi:hypothetical protein